MIMILPQLLLLMPLYVTLVGGDLVAKEYEEGTLRMILSRPISRPRLLFVKWVAGVIFAISQVLFLGAVALLFARILFPWRSMFVLIPGEGFGAYPPGAGLERFAFAHLFMALNARMMLSVAFIFSSFNMKPAAATILALSYILLNFVLDKIPFFDQYKNWFITYHMEAWVRLFQSPVQWPVIIQSECVIIGSCATAFIIGCTAFQVRDIKS